MKSKFLLVFLTVLVPAYLVNPIQAQEGPSLQVSNGGLHELPLKAIQDSDGDIETQEDFEIQPDDIITVGQSADFHVLPNGGAVEAVKITDNALQTTDLDFSASTGRVSQSLAPKAYLLDIIVLMDNDDRYLYETVLAVLAPGQTLQQVNTQNIIQNFVTTRSDTHTTVVFRDSDDDDDDDDEDEPSICYFEPNTAPECKPLPDGSCPNGWPHNDDGNCHPGGKCPDGFERVDDDETGTCYDTDDTFHCPGSNAIVLDEDDCAIYEPDEPDSVCYFDPNDEECDPLPEGGCPEGFGFNDDERCIPQGQCPDGFHRANDDESGRCIDEEDLQQCDNGSWAAPDDTCPEPVAPVEEDETCEPGFAFYPPGENGRCEPLDSNCGGVPCTASEKEDSTTSDPVPGTSEPEPEPEEQSESFKANPETDESELTPDVEQKPDSEEENKENGDA